MDNLARTTDAQADPIRKPLLHEELAARLSDMIFAGELVPGVRVPEKQLCQRFGISRTPLREALKVLAADGLITRLIRLRDALLANDERGITLAGEGLDEDVSRIAEVRADIGVRSRRLATATEREEDLRILDQSLASDIRDLDFSEAAVRFSLLQQQLQAGLSSASRLVQISLLDFLR